MNRTHLLQLSADLDRVINLDWYVPKRVNGDDEAEIDRHGGVAINPGRLAVSGGIGVGGVLGHQAIARRGGYKAVGRQIGNVGERYKMDRALAGAANSLNSPVSRSSSVWQAIKQTGKAIRHMSAKTENLLTLSAELDQVINFDFMSMVKKYGPAVGKSALKWGGIGAAGGAVAGGVSGALSDDPNKTALGGAMSGAMAGGTLGALGGAGMRGMKINSAINKAATMKAARLAGTPGAAAAPSAAAAPTATAAADQMAAAAAQPAKAAAAVGKPSAYAEMPSGNASFVQPRHVTDPMGYGIGGNTINPMPGKINVARTTSALRDPNTSVADALTNKRKAIYENGMNTPRGMKNPTVFSSRLQSLVQLSAELDGVVQFDQPTPEQRKQQMAALLKYQLRNRMHDASQGPGISGNIVGGLGGAYVAQRYGKSTLGGATLGAIAGGILNRGQARGREVLRAADLVDEVKRAKQ